MPFPPFVIITNDGFQPGFLIVLVQVKNTPDMPPKELVEQLKSAIADYEELVKEQEQLAVWCASLLAAPALETQFLAIRTHDDVSRLSDSKVTAMLPLVSRHLSIGFSTTTTSRAAHATVFLWDVFLTRPHVFQTLPPLVFQTLARTILNPSFPACAGVVLTPAETQQLQAFFLSARVP